MMQTINEQLALERLARKHERHLKFLRHSPYEHRWIPFADEAERVEFKEALVGTIAFVAFIAFLALAPWWFA
ncbi:MAG: hypothetical protein RBT67_02960 [Thauera sp.]|jgi:hypothetical protein|nr:hypothetical protein [Thauera sp.]